MKKNRLLRTGLALAALASLALPLVSSAELVTQTLVVSRAITPEAIVPTLQVDEGNDFQFRIINPTEMAVFVNVAGAENRTYILPLSERNVAVDLTGASASQRLAYTIESTTGKRLASGEIYRGGTSLYSANVPETQRISLSSDGIIGSWPEFASPAGTTNIHAIATRVRQARQIPPFEFRQSSDVYIPPADQEPVTRRPISTQGPIRGYW